MHIKHITECEHLAQLYVIFGSEFSGRQTRNALYQVASLTATLCAVGGATMDAGAHSSLYDVEKNSILQNFMFVRTVLC